MSANNNENLESKEARGIVCQRIYIDIETVDKNPNTKDTFNPQNHKLTVCGMLLEYTDEHTELVQLVFSDTEWQKSLNRFYEIIDNAIKTNPAVKLVGYNILRFDIPVLYYNIGFNPPLMMLEDLMFECWKHSLTGGLKKVCNQLSICRPNNTQGDGITAKFLWYYYEDQKNPKFLEDLLKYNADDLYVLVALRKKLYEMGRDAI